jgi:hypothetical protein
MVLPSLFGEKAPLSASTVVGLKEKLQAEYNACKTRKFKGSQLAYVSVDGTM